MWNLRQRGGAEKLRVNPDEDGDSDHSAGHGDAEERVGRKGHEDE